jgi:nicotinate-nucleotide pyrophosphorylase (carboxylating)
MKADYRSQTIDPPLLDDLSHLVRLAIREDLDRIADITTMAIVPQGVTGTALIVPRVTGKAAGIDLIESMLQELDSSIQLELFVGDGESFAPKQPIAALSGDARDLLTCERTILNFLGRLCGIATLTSKYVEQVERQSLRHAKNNAWLETFRKIRGPLWRGKKSSTRAVRWHLDQR